MKIIYHPTFRTVLRCRPIRFLLVGGLNTLFGYGAFAAFLFFGLSPSAALAFATVAGIAFNFVTSASLTFGSFDTRRLPAFCLTYAVLFVINLLVLRSFIAFGIRPAYAQATIVLPLAALSYVIQRDFVFRKPSSEGYSV